MSSDRSTEATDIFRLSFLKIDRQRYFEFSRLFQKCSPQMHIDLTFPKLCTTCSTGTQSTSRETGILQFIHPVCGRSIELGTNARDINSVVWLLTIYKKLCRPPYPRRICPFPKSFIRIPIITGPIKKYTDVHNIRTTLCSARIRSSNVPITSTGTTYFIKFIHITSCSNEYFYHVL